MFFSKMQALGNDFVIVDLRASNAVTVDAPLAKWVSDRRRGVGCDQLLILKSSNSADLSMEIYNADGSVAEACGNGARCVAWLWMTQHDKREVSLQVHDRILHAWLKGEHGVSIDMGQPCFDEALTNQVRDNAFKGFEYRPDASSVMGNNLNNSECLFADEAYNHSKNTISQINANTGGRTRIPWDASSPATFVSMGNPHLVVESSVVGDTCANDILSHTKEIFPDGVNIEWLRVLDSLNISIKIYERGVGETHACGTGACAAAVVAISSGRCESSVTVSMLGGQVDVSLGETAVLTGEVSFVFSGEIDYSATCICRDSQ
ncbi:MAG: diaminopimelate epimerase [Holosporales bacterium]|nr:diaminopimelate epimerase [Holosporales bacterium]